MKEILDRLIDEEKELDDKITKLNTALKYAKISEYQIGLLNIQLGAMLQYRGILELRILDVKKSLT